MRLWFHRRFEFAVALLGLILVAISGHAPAANSPSATRGEGALLIPPPMTMFLHAESVFNELGLSSEQKVAVGAAVDQADLSLWRMRDLPLGERNRGARSVLDSLRAKLSAALAPRQLERLDQLVLQVSGVRAILEPGVAAALGLSNGQRQRIQAVLVPLAGHARGEMDAGPHRRAAGRAREDNP